MPPGQQTTPEVLFQSSLVKKGTIREKNSWSQQNQPPLKCQGQGHLGVGVWPNIERLLCCKHLVLSGLPHPPNRKCLEKAWFQGLMSYHIHRPQSWKVKRQKYSLPRQPHPLRHKFAVGRSKGSEKQPYRTTTIAKGCGTEAQWPEDTKEQLSRKPKTSKSKEQRVMH